MQALVTMISAAWNRQLLGPAIALLRALITIAAIASALFAAWLGMKAHDDDAWIFVVLAWLAIASGYFILMIGPDTLAVLLRLEKGTRSPAAALRAPRYTALHVYSVFMRVVALCALAMIFHPALAWISGKAREFIAWDLELELEVPANSEGWLILELGTVIVAALAAAWVWWRDRRSTGSIAPGAAPLVAALTVVILARQWVMDVGGLEEGGAVSWLAVAVVMLWTVAGILFAAFLLSGRVPSPRLMIWLAGGVVVASWALFTRWPLLFNPDALLSGLTMPLVEQQTQGLFAVTDLIPGAVRAAILAAALLVFAVVAWMKSDAARVVIDLERNLRSSSAGRPPRSIHVAVATFAGTIAAAMIVLLALARMTFRTEWFDFGNIPAEVRNAIDRSIFGVDPVWFAIANVVSIFATVNLIRWSFDLVRETEHEGKAAPLRFLSLRVIVAVQYLLAGACALLPVALFWKAAEHADGEAAVMLGIAGIAIGAVLFLFVSFFAAILANAIQLEANSRGSHAGTIGYNGRYPGLSALASAGKAMAILLTIGSAGALAWAISKDEEAILAAPLVFVVYVLASALPDSARLLLTIERNLVNPAAAAAPAAAPAVQPS